jgi:hypothetical protein
MEKRDIEVAPDSAGVPLVARTAWRLKLSVER